jgi:CheY-like chemotaxis protein
MSESQSDAWVLVLTGRQPRTAVMPFRRTWTQKLIGGPIPTGRRCTTARSPLRDAVPDLQSGAGVVDWGHVRVAICDDERALVALVEELVTGRDHEVIGVADNTVDAVHLVEHGHPDLVIVDPAVGCSSDFDVIETSSTVGAAIIAFTRSADMAMIKDYAVAPTVVPKPDLVALDAAIARTSDRRESADGTADRRRRPAREAAGEPPTGPHDPAPFYGALTDAQAGDALVAIFGESLPSTEVATTAMTLVRHGDRVAVTGWAVVALLPGGGKDAIDAFTQRLRDSRLLEGGAAVVSAVVEDGESGPEAFARLRSSTQ